MTMLYRDADVAAVLTPEIAVAALEVAIRHEAVGLTQVPGRLNATAPEGWIRLMPAVIDGEDGDAAVGFKVMNLNRKTGVRYVEMLYDPHTGELQAIMDAARLTRVRTAAVTAIACRCARPEPLTELGLFGSGHEAEGHAEAFKALFPELERIVVFSPNAERRASFAARMGAQLGIEVTATEDPSAAAQMPVSILATKTTEVVARSEWFPRGALVLSIGSTRPDLRELDAKTFARSRQCLADAPAQLLKESGDVQAAVEQGHTTPEQLISLADVVAGTTTLSWPPEDLLVFKSVGTALQDLAVATAVHRACTAAGLGADLAWDPVRH